MDKRININEVTGPYSAVVSGQPTGFCGCDPVAPCSKSHLCLRSNSALVVRDAVIPDKCLIFIPAGEVAA